MEPRFGLLEGVVVLDEYLGNLKYKGKIFYEKNYVSDATVLVIALENRQPTQDALRSGCNT